MAVTDTLKDAAYVTIGAGVLGFQKAQVRRQELLKQLREQRGTIEAQLALIAGQIEELMAPVRSQMEAGIDAVEAALPATVQDAVKQARAAVLAQERAVRARLGLTNAA